MKDLLLNKYEILEAIGSGGMATVYRGRMVGPHGFEKMVAIKILNEESLHDSDVMKMFIDEARLGARLQHPNIVSILDFGESEGKPFIVMEYVDGTSLSTILKSPHMLDFETASYVCTEVLNGLMYAHSLVDSHGKPLNIVHRDVSPHNILIDRNGGVKLCDFGIATGAFRSDRTKTGVIKGKVAYMSPEHAKGEGVDVRSDLYSLGLTLLAMILKHPPFEGKNTEDVRTQSVKGIPPEKIKSLSCPDNLKTILERALAIDPQLRFQSAKEFLDAFEGSFSKERSRQLLAQIVNETKTSQTKEKKQKKKNANPQQIHPPNLETKSSSTVRVAGTRNILIIIGFILLIALIMALLKLQLPEI